MRYAFVMGSNGPENLSPLKYAKNDVKRMKTCLEGPRCAYEVISPSANAKPFDIRQNLIDLAERCTHNDTFICYFAGHGLLDKGQLFLLWDETDINRLGTTSIPSSAVLEAFRFCKAHSMLLILDCCHAGGAVSYTGLRNALNEPVGELIKPDNHLVLMASDRLERAREIEELEGGFLTNNIISAIEENFYEVDQSGDGKLSLQEIVVWLRSKAKQHNENFPSAKVPYPYTFGQERGEFTFTVDDSEWIPYEIPWHDGSIMVVLPIHPQDDKAFCISKHPVTNKQYQKFVGSNYTRPPVGQHFYKSTEIEDSSRSNGEWQGPFCPWQSAEFNDQNKPVVCVSYQDSIQYCEWVTECTPHQFHLTSTKLPSVKIWDFAALGNEFRTSNPEIWLTQSQKIHHNSTAPANIDFTGMRWNSRAISDMFGNIWEWCSSKTSERYNPSYTAKGFFNIDPSHNAELRGGGFFDDLANVEPFLQASRLAEGTNTCHSDLGFRIAADIAVEILPEEIRLRLSLCKHLSKQDFFYFPPVISAE